MMVVTIPTPLIRWFPLITIIVFQTRTRVAVTSPLFPTGTRVAVITPLINTRARLAVMNLYTLSRGSRFLLEFGF
jgi:hypothetical protein